MERGINLQEGRQVADVCQYATFSSGEEINLILELMSWLTLEHINLLCNWSLSKVGMWRAGTGCTFDILFPASPPHFSLFPPSPRDGWPGPMRTDLFFLFHDTLGEGMPKYRGLLSLLFDPLFWLQSYALGLHVVSWLVSINFKWPRRWTSVGRNLWKAAVVVVWWSVHP